MNYLWAFLVLFVVSSASAQRTGMVYGPGIQSCGKYLAERKDNDPTINYQYTSWIRGYVSGYNIWGGGKQVTKEVDSEAMLAYLDLYCRDNPLSKVIAGANRLLDELSRSVESDTKAPRK